MSVTHIVANPVPGGIVTRADGQLSYRTIMGAVDEGPFSARLTIGVAPMATPGSIDLVDLWKVTDVQVQRPGIAGVLVDSILPLIRGYVDSLLIGQLRAILRNELPALVSQAFALAALPADVVVSVRKLSIDATAIEFSRP